MASSLEKRVAVLEQQVQELLERTPAKTALKDWRRAIGLFPGDEVMKQIDAAGQAIREEDRRQARSNGGIRQSNS